MLFAAALAPVGCGPKQKPEASAPSDGPPKASVTLRVAVVSDEALRLAIERLRGEWKLATDGVIETVALPADADLAQAATEADLIVFPSRSLGELCEADLLRPMRPNVLRSEELRFGDILPLVREHEIVYAEEVMALPLGCPTPLHLCPDAGPNVLTAPDDDLELALAYLAWATPHAVHRSRVATLFDSDDFKPRLAEPPFARALEDLVAQARELGEARIIWPRRGEPMRGGSAPQLMPATEEVYNPIAEEWETVTGASGPEHHATLLASSGRLIAVTRATRNAATAFRFAAWLAGPENARQISTASDHVAICRGKFARAGDAWRASDDRQQAKEFSELTAEALRFPRFLLAPRLPGSEEYLGALGNHVRDAIDGTPPQEALNAAAADWEAISVARGRDAQRAAYQRSLNSARFPSRE